jgi:glucokinase
MQSTDVWAIGIDLGGTKTDVGFVESGGHIRRRLRRSTHVKGGPGLIKAEIVATVHELLDPTSSAPVGVGVGLAGQIDPREGIVRFSPNLGWRDIPFQRDLSQALGLPVVITNDVRAITWGEWLHGAGQGCNDLICLFVGTGIGGGVISGGKILSGSTNAAGEMGHLIIDWNGPSCTCGNRGCLEALAGGWAIARQAQEVVSRDPSAGSLLLEMVRGKQESITAETVARAAQRGDPLARQLIDRVAEALIAGSVSLVHAFNPSRFILGGGVIEGLPELVDRVAEGIFQRAFAASAQGLQVLPSKLKENAGIVGAAMLAIHTFVKKERHHE